MIPGRGSPVSFGGVPMRLIYSVLFLVAFAAALVYFHQVTEGPQRPVEAWVRLRVPGMT